MHSEYYETGTLHLTGPQHGGPADSFLLSHAAAFDLHKNGTGGWRFLATGFMPLGPPEYGSPVLVEHVTFFVLGSFCEIMDRGKFVITIGISSIFFIPMTIWTWSCRILKFMADYQDWIVRYTALLIVLFIQREWRTQNWIWIVFYIIMLVLLPAKIIYEMTSGLTFFVNNIHTNMVSVPLAHLVGGVVGFAVGMDTVA